MAKKRVRVEGKKIREADGAEKIREADGVREADDVEKISENDSTEGKKMKEDTGKMRFQGYFFRIMFVLLVAVAFSYRAQIMEAVNSAMGSSQGTPPSEPLPTTTPPKEPLKPKDPDYYNPPFDPEDPPAPLYSKSGTRLITANELAEHGHSGPLKPIWLAILGKVFNVDKGAEHYYGPDGGYNFFTGTKNGATYTQLEQFNQEFWLWSQEGGIYTYPPLQ